MKIQPPYINCTQRLGHRVNSRSGVKMFIRVVILVFAATCCTAQVTDVCDNHLAWEQSGKFEGDIMLTEEQRNGVINTANRWPNKEVPFFIDNLFTDDERNQILQAIEHFHRNTTIRFKPYDPQNDRDFIHITREDTGCWSYIGRIGGRQQLNLQRIQCIWHGTILHELVHALGFYHQHNAADRDDYITIRWENIIPGQEGKFDKYNTTSFGVPYDYDSIMHYGDCAFSKNGQRTITPRVPNVQIGQNRLLSERDIEKIEIMYENTFTTTDGSTSLATRSQFITLIIITLHILTHLQ